MEVLVNALAARPAVLFEKSDFYMSMYATRSRGEIQQRFVFSCVKRAVFHRDYCSTDKLPKFPGEAQTMIARSRSELFEKAAMEEASIGEDI